MSLDYNTLSPTHSPPFIPSMARLWITGYVKGYFLKAAEMREEIAVWHQLTLDSKMLQDELEGYIFKSFKVITKQQQNKNVIVIVLNSCWHNNHLNLQHHYRLCHPISSAAQHQNKSDQLTGRQPTVWRRGDSSASASSSDRGHRNFSFYFKQWHEWLYPRPWHSQSVTHRPPIVPDTHTPLETHSCMWTDRGLGMYVWPNAAILLGGWDEKKQSSNTSLASCDRDLLSEDWSCLSLASACRQHWSGGTQYRVQMKECAPLMWLFKKHKQQACKCKFENSVKKIKL